MKKEELKVFITKNQMKFKLLAVVVIMALIVPMVMMPAGAAQAEIRSYRWWSILEGVLYEGVPFTFVYTVCSSVKGEEVIRHVYVDEYSCSGSIKNYYYYDWWGNIVPAYPFDICVVVSRGEFIDGRNVVLTFDNRDLSPYDVLSSPLDRCWWGGKMSPNIYMWEDSMNRVWVRTGWIATSNGFVCGAGVNDVNHIF